MSISPDFAKKFKVGHAWVWALTGSHIGVPREDKKEARRIAAELKAKAKTGTSRSKRGSEKSSKPAKAASQYVLLQP